MPDLADVRGQAHARRALEIAAAGAHHLLLVGPPGSGKTLLASRLGGILPEPSDIEALEFDDQLTAAGLAFGEPCQAEHALVIQATDQLGARELADFAQGVAQARRHLVA